MGVRWRRALGWVCLSALVVSWLLPTLRLPGQTLNGAELIRLGTQTGISRLFGEAARDARVDGLLLLLAITSNLVMPAVWFARRRLSVPVAAAMCVVTLGASVVLTARVAGRPSAHWLVGAGVWYAALAGLLCTRFWPARA